MDTKKFSENPIVCKAKGACKSLCDIRLKKDCEMTLSLYDKKSPNAPECTHTIKSSSDHSLIKMLAVVGVVSIALSAICCVCSLFKD